MPVPFLLNKGREFLNDRLQDMGVLPPDEFGPPAPSYSDAQTEIMMREGITPRGLNQLEYHYENTGEGVPAEYVNELFRKGDFDTRRLPPRFAEMYRREQKEKADQYYQQLERERKEFNRRNPQTGNYRPY